MSDMTETQKTDTATTTADNTIAVPVATLAMVTLDAPDAAVL